MLSFLKLKIPKETCMKHRERPLFKRKEHGLFSIKSSIPQLIIIAIVIGCYYFILANGYYPLWMTWIYYAAKAIIALEIIIAGAKSLIVPLIAIAAGAINLYLTQVNQVQYLTANDATQLIIVGIIAFCITFIVRSIRK
jgi:hypothetical protein